jgi:hypothetical protein
MKVMWMAGILAAASGLALPASSEAGARVGIGITIGDRGYGGYGRAYVDTYQLGYGRGYQDGLDRGRNDGRRGDRFDFWREKCYRNGDAGYRRDYGPKYEYVNAYRRGFEEGYRRAYGSRRRDYRDHRDWRDRDDRYNDDRYRNRDWN